jgi:hypothetical protein
MPPFDLSRRIAAEALGTALLVATVVGSGIMAETLTRDVALALLGNTLPTGAILVVLITILGPISGAHFNPAVTLIFALKRELSSREALCYVAAQIAGGIAGTMLAHAMFALPLVDASLKMRSAARNGWLKRLPLSAWSRPFSPASNSTVRLCPGWSGFTSRRPIGSPRRRRLPIPRSPSRGRSRTRFRASAPSIFPDLSPPNSSAHSQG